MRPQAFESHRGEPFVLIVDDEPSVLEVTRSMAGSLGWQPLLANTAGHALAVFRDHAESIAYVLLDLHLPGADTDAVVHELRSIRPDVPIEIMTGDATGAEALVARHLVDGLLVKPFVLADLELALAAHARAA